LCLKFAFLLVCHDNKYSKTHVDIFQTFEIFLHKRPFLQKFKRCITLIYCFQDKASCFTTALSHYHETFQLPSSTYIFHSIEIIQLNNTETWGVELNTPLKFKYNAYLSIPVHVLIIYIKQLNISRFEKKSYFNHKIKMFVGNKSAHLPSTSPCILFHFEFTHNPLVHRHRRYNSSRWWSILNFNGNINNATAEIHFKIIAVLLHLQIISINSNVAPQLCSVQNELRFEDGNQSAMGRSIR
jgi:hypothetical protein